MAVVERLSTGATLTWNAATVLKVVDFAFGGESPPEDVTGQEDGTARDYIAGLIELDAFRFSIIYDAIDTVHAALNTDFAAGTPRAAVFTGPDGVIYAWTMVIEELTEHAPLGGVVRADLVLALSDRDTVSEAGI
jgi:hypothetical protein